MKQLTSLLLIATVLLGVEGTQASAAPLLIDDFDQYVSGSYIQNQPGSPWTRFGTATSDGIYSVANPSPTQRAASYHTNFSSGSGATNGYVRYTYSAPVDLGEYYGFSLDLRTNAVRPDTQVFAQITATVGGDTTVIETLAGQSVHSTSDASYEFLFTADNLRVVQGALPLSTVLSNLTSITFRFHNSMESGSQTFVFDNLYALEAPASIPEPSTVAMLFGAGALGLLWKRRNRSR